MKQITGAELFVKALKEENVDTLFAYPGGQAIDLFDALYREKDIDIILPRHEQGLIHAAHGYARSTGKTGVCLVTSGPGAANLVTGIAMANYDSVPLVCFTGQVPTSLIGNNAFQEIDIVGITRSICKYAVTVWKREELAEAIKKAFTIAKTGKPGAAVVDLPKDIQRAYGSAFYRKGTVVGSYRPDASAFLPGGEYGTACAGREMTPRMILRSVKECFKDAIIVADVGQNQLWTMGYGFPAAIGAKLGNPRKDVVVISDDGGIQMNIRELATAVAYELPIIVCILNHGYAGNIPNHCFPEYTPDFVALAESYGATGIRVTKAEDIEAALSDAKRNTKSPTLVEFFMDREANVMPRIP